MSQPTANLVDLESLDHFRNRLFEVQCEDGSVIYSRIKADEENDVFVVGRFQRVGNTPGHALDGGQRDHADRRKPRVFRVFGQGKQSAGGIGRQVRLTLPDDAFSARREHMLAIEDGVEQGEALFPVLGVDEEADVHVETVGQFFVCEGSHTARLLLDHIPLAANLQPRKAISQREVPFDTTIRLCTCGKVPLLIETPCHDTSMWHLECPPCDLATPRHCDAAGGSATAASDWNHRRLRTLKTNIPVSA